MSTPDTRVFWWLSSTFLKTLILISLLVYCKVLGLEIDIGKDPLYTHCISSNEPLQLLNPFLEELGSNYEAAYNNPNFISMEWAIRKPGQGDVDILRITREPEVLKPGYTVYKLWSLQINNVEADDTATYIARLTVVGPKKIINFNFTVAKTPALKSDKITVTKQQNEAAGTVTYKCGQIADLGTPPINFYWKSVKNGSILPAEYKDGFLTITLPESEEITCEIDKNSPAAKCIPEAEMGRWDGTSVGQSSSSSADTKYIIIGSVAAGIVVGVIIIIILVVLIIKRKKGENYNAKKEEAKVEARSETNIPLVDRSFDENDSARQPKGGSRTPIYRGPSESPSPRTVSRSKANNNSRIQQASDDDYEEYNANGKPPPVAPKYRKKNEVRDDGDGEEIRPPKVKPRSIFLTPSMEELDKINTAVQGGKGSEPRDAARRGSEPRETARRGSEPRETARRGAEPWGSEPRDTARRGTEPRGMEPKGPAPRGTLV
ncbi:unnamed protein product [Lymnaea stagnalis]|uniref:Ig-like domain-containing protein n=1 Tax=Lymnaea stagnalis TaxID=6523 RepID=A0AAV2H780_LYMST